MAMFGNFVPDIAIAGDRHAHPGVLHLARCNGTTPTVHYWVEHPDVLPDAEAFFRSTYDVVEFTPFSARAAWEAKHGQHAPL